MRLAHPFVHMQVKDNLVHLKKDEPVGEWRDSTYGWSLTSARMSCQLTATGLGAGRIPFDVNTALMPAALRSIAALARAGVYTHRQNWRKQADHYAKVWEDQTLQFFEVGQPSEARSRADRFRLKSRNRKQSSASPTMQKRSTSLVLNKPTPLTETSTSTLSRWTART